MDSLDDKLKEFEDKLTESFVEKYEDVKEWMVNVNIILNNLNINYRYDSYDIFCVDYREHCLNYAREKKDIDFVDPRMVLLWIPFVLSNLIISKSEIHGRKVLPLNSGEKNKKQELLGLIDNLISSKSEEEIKRYENNIKEIMENDFNIDNSDDITKI